MDDGISAGSGGVMAPAATVYDIVTNETTCVQCINKGFVVVL